MFLNQLKNFDIKYVKNVGEKKSLLFHRLNIFTLYDLLTFYPFRFEDRKNIVKIKDIKEGVWQTVEGKVLAFDYFYLPQTKKKVLKIIIGDDTGFFSLICYNRNFLKNIFKKGKKVFISSNKFIYRYNELQTADFEYEIIDEDNEKNKNINIHTGRIVPIYHTTEKLSNKFIRNLIYRELNKIIHKIDDPLPNYIKEKYKLKNFALCLYKMHFPANLREVEIVRQRLAFDRFFFLELILALNKKEKKSQKKIQKYQKESLMDEFISSLKFRLTSDQKKVLNEIISDLKSNKLMNRLLMGDVGSGKTIVALITALFVIENGWQVAFMVPTEILAQQHYSNISHLLKDFNISVVLLTGKNKQKDKKATLEKIKKGEAQLVVGTHALIEEKVKFKKLGYIIIDEQHRFGVMQRAQLHLKSQSPDVLVMTATPIPRTLSLTVYGDLDISVIKELPPGRIPIKTFWFPDNKLDEVYDLLRNEMRKKHQVYVVYPLVKESEKMDLKDAETMYENFRNHIFKEFKVGLLHGQMKKEEKDLIMEKFQRREIDILVATTVIEVGVDVANATVMVIEHAERFGLAQLHQLRGRIGRGDLQSYCILITNYKLSEDAKKRMKAMVKYNNGFKLAEIDLELRGPGELLGVRQTGLPDLKPANLIKDQNILEKAKLEAFELIEKEPDLKSHPQVKEFLKNEEYGNLQLIKVS